MTTNGVPAPLRANRHSGRVFDTGAPPITPLTAVLHPPRRGITIPGGTVNVRLPPVKGIRVPGSRNFAYTVAKTQRPPAGYRANAAAVSTRR